MGILPSLFASLTLMLSQRAQCKRTLINLLHYLIPYYQCNHHQNQKGKLHPATRVNIRPNSTEIHPKIVYLLFTRRMCNVSLSAFLAQIKHYKHVLYKFYFVHRHLNNSWYNRGHSLFGKPYLAAIASNVDKKVLLLLRIVALSVIDLCEDEP